MVGACARLIFLVARKALEQERYRGTERRKQLRGESRLELFFRSGCWMGAALRSLYRSALAPACSWRTPGTASVVRACTTRS